MASAPLDNWDDLTGMRYGGRKPYGVPPRPIAAPLPAPETWSTALVLRVLLEPSVLFEELRGRTPWGLCAAFIMIHAAVVTAVGSIAAGLGLYLQAGEVPDYYGTVRMLATAASAASIAAGLALVLSALVAVVLHPVAVLCRGYGGFSATYASVVYGAVPAGVATACAYSIAVLMPELRDLTPAIIAAGVLWTCAVCAVGLVRLHQLDGLGAVVSAVAPVGLAAVIMLWLAAPGGPVQNLWSTHPVARKASTTLRRLLPEPPGAARMRWDGQALRQYHSPEKVARHARNR